MTTFAPDMRRKGKGFDKDGFTGMPDFDESTGMPVTEDYQDFTGMPEDATGMPENVTGEPEVRGKGKRKRNKNEYSTGMPDFDESTAMPVTEDYQDFTGMPDFDDSTGMPVTEDFQDFTGMPVTEAL